MDARKALEIATAIVDDLFTNGAGEAADRLVMIQELEGGRRRDLGGWSKVAVQDRVAKLLEGV
jgi:hypothetical protein